MKEVFLVFYWGFFKPSKYESFMNCASVGMLIKDAVKYTQKHG